ncbi:helix-hairpin-helix domain-containing protein [Liquorilactobacillus hordei]|uniref:helix-hairpin-helix domain-containing protein n=1 Tax=Liquorilactobacillus hordei TaxID=468911 RepID=UPI0039EC58DD
MDKLYELWIDNKKLCITVIIIFLGLSSIFIVFILKKGLTENKGSLNFSKSSSETVIKSDTNTAGKVKSKKSQEISIDIKGAVKYPGVYVLKNGARVNEIVKKAGGMLENADNNQVNLALILQDQNVVYIPFEGEFSNSLTTTVQSSSKNVTDTTATSNGQSVSESETHKYDINEVTKEELETIPGIGDKKAEQILAYRTEHGRINQLDELKEISGVGDKTFEKFQMYLEVSP